MLTVAFDTATDVATCAVVRDGDVLAESRSRAVRILEDVDALLAEGGATADDVGALVVGTGPGSYTGLRMGLITERTLAFSLGVPIAGVSTLDALAAGSRGAVPVIDARRGEVFTLRDGDRLCVRAEEIGVEAGATYVGDGAVRYRATIEAGGGTVPPDASDVHVPWARHHVALAGDFDGPERVEPIYLRAPDAERAARA